MKFEDEYKTVYCKDKYCIESNIQSDIVKPSYYSTYKGLRYYKGYLIHKETGPAIEYINGDKEWYIEGKRHRKDGPALENYNGIKFWYIDGKKHREDGPAEEWRDGECYWYLNGKEYSEENYLSIINLKSKSRVLNEI